MEYSRFLIYALLMIFQFHPAISTIHAMLKLVHIQRRNCRAMPRKRDVNLSHCGNANSTRPTLELHLQMVEHFALKA